MKTRPESTFVYIAIVLAALAVGYVAGLSRGSAVRAGRASPRADSAAQPRRRDVSASHHSARAAPATAPQRLVVLPCVFFIRLASPSAQPVTSLPVNERPAQDSLLAQQQLGPGAPGGSSASAGAPAPAAGAESANLPSREPAQPVGAGEQAAPGIRFAGTEHDFGIVLEGDTVQHDFQFENRGSAKLAIARVTTSCGCTAALASAQEIEPGSAGRIAVSFNTQGYEGLTNRTIYVESNDPKSPRVELALTGLVKRAIRANPPSVYFVDVAPDATSSQTVRVVSDEVQFRIVKMTATSPQVSVSEARQSEKGGYDFDVTIGPGLPLGAVSASIAVETDYPKQRHVIVRLFGNVIQPRAAGG